jgi:FixJ family two-component response regulator
MTIPTSNLHCRRFLGLDVMTVGSPAEFLARPKPGVPSCLVLRLPGMNGLKFQADLAKANMPLPIIFVTGHGDIPMTFRTIKAGAIELLTKPFREQELLDAIRLALDRDTARRERDLTMSSLTSSYRKLTRREQQVFPLVTSGLMNKQIAHNLGVSEFTTKCIEERHAKDGRGVDGAALVRMADALSASRTRNRRSMLASRFDGCAGALCC